MPSAGREPERMAPPLRAREAPSWVQLHDAAGTACVSRATAIAHPDGLEKHVLRVHRDICAVSTPVRATSQPAGSPQKKRKD
ncbi:hypothetical protein PsYK624_039300 [Phanerochaete sordida]|uniref:Uncharacterized protein n=1 Tax=Phanerochaete sordida TaxID=48140 RepID=A0A9P3G2I9_9APHY|nr:hypothetical protein PsYK624_039300 [Phanerochaete sordida]